MTMETYEARKTALLMVDPYNDFLSEGGKIWPKVQEVAESVGLLANLRALNKAFRDAGMAVATVPHRRWREGDYETWDHPNPTQRAIMHRHSFAFGEWGGDWHPDFVPQEGDIVASEHWGQSGFANTDLEMRLRQIGITHVVIVGLLAHTCIDSTARFAMELGFHVTLVTDASATYSQELMHAAHELSAPTYAHAILKTADVLSALPKEQQACA